MSLFQATAKDATTGQLWWFDNEGTVTKQLTLSDVSFTDFVWGLTGEYFYTASNYSTGRIEMWSRNGTTYTWRKTGIDRVFVRIAPDASGNLYVASQDDIWILGFDDGVIDYSNIASDLSGYSVYGLVVDPSTGDAHVLAQENSYIDIKVFVFDNTLTLTGTVTLYTGYYNIPYAGKHIFSMDSSGNYFLSETSNNRIHKYNSSGTEQWYYYNGSGSSASSRHVQANGKIYVFGYTTYNTIARLTDNGGSYSTDWTVVLSTSYYPADMAVTADEIYVFSGGYTYPTTALDESDGSALTGWSDIQPFYNNAVGVELDPLLTLSAGHIEETYSPIMYRAVKTGGYEIIGAFEVTEQNTIHGFGDAIIDKLYGKGNYSYIGTPTPRYENFIFVGDPPSEDISIKSYAYQEGAMNVVVDPDYNIYLIDYRPYTAGEASAASNGAYTTAASYYTLRKYNAAGVFQWTTQILIGGYSTHILSADFQYVYTMNNTNNTGYGFGNIERWSVVDGSRNTDGDWPYVLDDPINDGISSTMMIGRDGYFYFAVRDDTDDRYYLNKVDGDLAPATGWSTPYQIPAENLPYYPCWVNSLDVNAAGYVLICTGSDSSGEYNIRIIEDDQTPLYEYEPPNGEYGAHYGLIDDDLNVYVRVYSSTSYYTYCIEPGETNHYDWTYTWRGATVLSTGEYYFYQAFWSEADYGEFIYYNSTGSGVLHSLHKMDIDGNEIWWGYGDDDTRLTFAGIAPIPVAAWEITVTFGSNGTVKMYWGGDQDDGGVPLTSGDVVLAEAGKDIKFMFVGDAGYYVEEVTVDGSSIGYAADYTFENVLYRHTLYVTFSTGFPSGPFTMTYELHGGMFSSIVSGHLSETYLPRVSKLNWTFVGGPIVETEQLTGYGFMTFAISLLMYINAYRSANGVDPLTEDEWLQDGADYAVADMVANGSLTLTLADIMGEEGANYPYEYASALQAILDVSFTAEDLFNALIADEDAEAVILGENFEEIAIAVQEYDGDNYVFILFAKWAWWYEVIRFDETERITTVDSLNSDTQFFEFMSAPLYADFQQSLDAGVALQRYAAKIGDYEIPNVTAFTYRLEVDVPSSLTVQALFDIDVFNQVKTLQGEGLTIETITPYNGEIIRNEVITVDFTTFSKIGGTNPKMSIGGYSSLFYYESSSELRNVMTRTKDENGKTRFRCSEPDFYIRPGCTVTWGTYSIVVERLVIFVSNGLTQYMEVTGE